MGGDVARGWVEQAFAEATRVGEPAKSAEASELLVHGIVDEALRTRLRTAAVRDVVLPCVSALLARSGARAPSSKASLSA
jgi:hypothetical protein